MSSNFFVIKKGKVWFLLKEEDIELEEIKKKSTPENEEYCSIYLD